MPGSAKTRILLADEDGLRREGLAAFLSGTDQFEVVTGAADGDAALESILDQRPDVAVVDLNLPKLHGIELLRRVRAESPGTKIIIVAGTADDEIVREVVRAGADGYLLKNGPARHLIDAISYVRDGGQYFSPQLHRDGRDRHLLEEPVRAWQEAPAGTAPATGERGDSAAPALREARGRRIRRPVRPTRDPAQFREQIREESMADLNERDYEIMSMMADGIRPILDRLDEIDGRVSQMETGAEPVPSEPRRWLNTQFADSVRDPRTGTDVAVLGRSVNDLEAGLPDLIEQAVTKRFHQMAEKLQQEIEETHVRTLETFVKNIQVKLVRRVSALEEDMSTQTEAMSQLRDYSQRTEDNLSRLISGVDKLAQELPRRLAAAAETAREAQYEATAEPVRSAGENKPSVLESRVSIRRTGSHRKVIMFWAVMGVLVLLSGVWWAATYLAGRTAGQDSPSVTASAAAGGTFKAPPANADTKTKMQAAQESVERKDYAVAEDLYKQIVKAEPGNVEALKALASVLYREDKIDESAAILDKLSQN